VGGPRDLGLTEVTALRQRRPVEEGVPALAPIPPIARWLPTITHHHISSHLFLGYIYEAGSIYGGHGRLRGRTVVVSGERALGW
jgi:hypothetical protein